MEWHTEVPSLVLVLALSFWMKYSAVQVLVNYWSVPVDQFCHMTALTLMMLVLGVKVHNTTNKGEACTWRDILVCVYSISLRQSWQAHSAVECTTNLFVNFYMYIVTIHSSLCKWPVTTCWWKYCKWRQSGDLYKQWVGNSVWWLLEQYRCHCGV